MPILNNTLQIRDLLLQFALENMVLQHLKSINGDKAEIQAHQQVLKNISAEIQRLGHKGANLWRVYTIQDVKSFLVDERGELLSQANIDSKLYFAFRKIADSNSRGDVSVLAYKAKLCKMLGCELEDLSFYNDIPDLPTTYKAQTPRNKMVAPEIFVQQIAGAIDTSEIILLSLNYLNHLINATQCEEKVKKYK